MPLSGAAVALFRGRDPPPLLPPRAPTSPSYTPTRLSRAKIAPHQQHLASQRRYFSNFMPKRRRFVRRPHLSLG
ncbi:hypothetical protein DENSPDRAFT_846323 [Dentipellis sp. KUC8613]|nr:hypothetical protein DENSPDRAFT_846323 [Dentipellis sp. KUC8613]